MAMRRHDAIVRQPASSLHQFPRWQAPKDRHFRTDSGNSLRAACNMPLSTGDELSLTIVSRRGSAERDFAMANAPVSTLNTLIESLKDGEQGFHIAGEAVKDASLRATFGQFSQQRARFARELQSEVSALGGEAQTTGSVAAAAHRGWINIKSALGGGEKSILNEAERGEDSAVHTYEKALNSDLPPSAATLVLRQAAEVKRAHERVRQLRDTWPKE
jgi:uncharacterized protein (TIGR02284 family)